MLTKKSISLLTLSALLVIPAGIASAEQMKLETDNVKLTIGEDGNIRVRSPQTGTTIVPGRTPASVRVLTNGTRVLKYPVTSSLCRETGTKNTSTVRSSSTVNRTQSTTSTTTCQ